MPNENLIYGKIHKLEIASIQVRLSLSGGGNRGARKAQASVEV